MEFVGSAQLDYFEVDFRQVGSRLKRRDMGVAGALQHDEADAEHSLRSSICEMNPTARRTAAQSVIQY